MNYFKIFNEIDNRDVHDLVFEVQQILNYDIGENNYFTFEILSSILKKKNIKFSYHDLDIAIKIFINDFEKVVRIDSWNLEPMYMVLDERHQQHNYQKVFYKFYDNIPHNNKKFIVISDTHIGNDDIQNFKLLHNIYDFSIKNNIRYIFHLGDIFQRVDNFSYDERFSKAMENINTFLREYPIVNEDELKTIGLLGNHDLSIHGTFGTNVYFDSENQLEQLYNLKDLSKDNPAFLMYARRTFGIELSNVPIHFSHKLYIDSLHKNHMINSVDDILSMEEKSFCQYPVCISGHLHKGLLCNDKDFFDNDHLYIGVPSTSNLNIGNVVAYIIDLNVESDIKYVDISAIYAKEDSSIYIGETFSHCLNQKNKVFKKEF